MDSLEHLQATSASTCAELCLAPKGLTLTRMMLESGTERVAVRIASQADIERLRLFVEVFGAKRVDALLEVRPCAQRDPSLAASFGLAPRWEVVPDPDSDRVASTAGSDADPAALARAAREVGPGRVLLRTLPPGASSPSAA
jgi:hypothetical protein